MQYGDDLATPHRGKQELYLYNDSYKQKNERNNLHNVYENNPHSSKNKLDNHAYDETKSNKTREKYYYIYDHSLSDKSQTKPEGKNEKGYYYTYDAENTLDDSRLKEEKYFYIYDESKTGKAPNGKEMGYYYTYDPKFLADEINNYKKEEKCYIRIDERKENKKPDGKDSKGYYYVYEPKYRD